MLGHDATPTASTWHWFAWRLWRQHYTPVQVAGWLRSHGVAANASDVAEYCERRAGHAMAVWVDARAQDRDESTPPATVVDLLAPEDAA